MNAQASWIWAATTSDNQAVLFRRFFTIRSIPARAVLYITCDNYFQLFINGQPADRSVPDPSIDVWRKVHRIDVASYLHSGKILIAVEGTNAGGPAGLLALMTFDEMNVLGTDDHWRQDSSGTASEDWMMPDYDDNGWQPSTVEAPANGGPWGGGLTGWPGYGDLPYLAHLRLPVAKVLDVDPGVGRILGQQNLPGHKDAILTVWPSHAPDAIQPSLVLDFGKEVAGRVLIDPLTNGTVLVGTGESLNEAVGSPWKGQYSLDLDAGQSASTPDSAFRYAHLVFPTKQGDTGPVKVRLSLDFHYYPVTYEGSFACSDPLLTKIWYTGAYTAHLCMQEDIWDAPKRDRARWSGDLQVSGSVIDDVFADKFLMGQTLQRLRDDAQGGQPPNAAPASEVNNIPGYSAAWFCTMADFHRHIGDYDFLRKEHASILSLLDYVASDFDTNHLFANPRNAWPFVDWSPDFDLDTPASRAATDLFLIRGVREAVFLLNELADKENAQKWSQWADTATQAARTSLVDPTMGIYGDRLQENAMAVYSGVATQQQTARIYRLILDPSKGAWDRTGSPEYNDGVITPYYGYFVLQALSDAGQTSAGEQLLTRYWGGMLAEGATTFWESYDPYWPKEDFHSHLDADRTIGFNTSLCHGWSSGPTSWLTERVLGVSPTGGGFRTVSIAPDLGNLQWVQGTVPTPRGPIRAGASRLSSGMSVRIVLPPGTKATVRLPGHRLVLNGKPVSQAILSDGYLEVIIGKPGAYLFTTSP
jgi:hypothetical protein